MMINQLKASPCGNFFLLAGPCVIEGEQMAMDIAEKVVGITSQLGIPYVFKGSYRKANRSRIDSFTGTFQAVNFSEALEKVRIFTSTLSDISDDFSSHISELANDKVEAWIKWES